MRGYEVWNGFYSVRHTVNQSAFAFWDTRLKAGNKVYGIANSDAHNTDMVANPHICAHLTELSKDSIYAAISRGYYYGSNGPNLKFSIDSVPMGGTLSIDSKKKVRIRMEGYSINGISSISLVKNGTTYRYYEYSNPLKRTAEVLDDQASGGDYYRVTVNDSKDLFAFSNPIFIFSTIAEDSTVIDPVAVDTTTEEDNSTHFSVYPNPASDIITVRMSSSTNGLISVFDSDGKVWIQELLDGSIEKKLSVQSLPKGIYILKINEKRQKLIIK